MVLKVRAYVLYSEGAKSDARLHRSYKSLDRLCNRTGLTLAPEYFQRTVVIDRSRPLGAVHCPLCQTRIPFIERL